MELRHLRYFITVAEELNFVRAAEKLNIVQPALSKQIQALEKELGVKLFDRVKRKIELTPVGQAFLEGAYQTLEVAEQAVIQAQRTNRGELGRLVVAYSSLVYFHLLPQILHLYKTRYPEVELVLCDLSTDHQFEGLTQGQLDIGFFVNVDGIIPTGKPYQNLRCESVLVEPIFVGLPPDHTLADRREISLRELEDSPWLFFSPELEPKLHAAALKTFEQAGYKPRVAQEISQQWFIVRLVAAGIGVSLFPSSAHSMAIGEVKFVKVVEPSWQTDFSVIWSSANASPTLQAFLEVVREVKNANLGEPP